MNSARIFMKLIHTFAYKQRASLIHPVCAADSQQHIRVKTSNFRHYFALFSIILMLRVRFGVAKSMDVEENLKLRLQDAEIDEACAMKEINALFVVAAQ